jgi:hypothetical protein
MAGHPAGRLGGGAEVEVATAAASGRTAGAALGVPLTERILARLPGPRLAWVVVWASVPWLNLRSFLPWRPPRGPRPGSVRLMWSTGSR